MRFFKIAMVLICALTSTIISAQNQNKDKVEINIAPNNIQTIPVPVDSFGIVIIQENRELKNAKERELIIIRFDKHFAKRWTSSIFINKKFELSQYKFDGKELFMVYSNIGEKQFEIIKVTPENGEVKQTTFFTLPNVMFYDMEVLQGKVFLVGAQYRKSVLFQLDLETKGSKLLNTNLGRSGSIIKSLAVHHSTNTVHATLVHLHPKKTEMIIRSFNAKGKGLVDELIMPQHKHKFLEAEFVELQNNHKIIVGTYTGKNSTKAIGYFYHHLDGNTTKYYPFKDEEQLKNYTSINRVFTIKNKVMVITENYDFVYSKGFPQTPQIYSDPNYSFNNVWAINNLSYNQTRMDVFTERLMEIGGYQIKKLNITCISEDGAVNWKKNLIPEDEDVSKKFKRYHVFNQGESMVFLNNLNGSIHRLNLNDHSLDFDNYNLHTDKDGNPAIPQGLVSATYWYGNYFLNIVVKGDNLFNNKKIRETTLLLSKVKG
ncbi:MAG: hypothetical protein KTR26_19685 [Flammeovirgaceae bacterium]|nr:hypothetical protein [Flammeovirgaceae bacterium]